MTLEDLIYKLDRYIIIRVVGEKTIYYGSVADFKDIVLAKRYVKGIFHYPNELLITINIDSKE